MNEFCRCRSIAPHLGQALELNLGWKQSPVDTRPCRSRCIHRQGHCSSAQPVVTSKARQSGRTLCRG